MAPSDLARAHLAAKERLQRLIASLVGSAWTALPHHDRAQVDQFLSTVLPLTAAVNRQVVALTTAFLARELGRQPPALDVQQVIAGIRNGTTPEEVYTRPFVTTWSALKDGKSYQQAVAMGLDRASTAAETDAQLAFTHTLGALGSVRGYEQATFERVPDGAACDLCQAASGQTYYTGDLLPIHGNCVTGDTLVSALGTSPTDRATEPSDLRGAHAATRRRYVGELIVIGTAAGYELSVTPNHPILTDRGWVAAGLLREGDSVISSRRRDGVAGHVPHEEDMPTRIEDHFRTGLMHDLVTVPFATEHFHGDIGEGEVEVIGVNRDLAPWVLASFAQPPKQLDLPVGLGLAAGLACQCGRRAHGPGARSAADRRMRSSRSRLALFGSLSGGIDETLLGLRSPNDASQSQVTVDRGAVHAEAFRQGKHRLTGEVQLDSVRHLRRFGWKGHVYNLVTSQGWYVGNGILTHNCRCGVAFAGYADGGSRGSRADEFTADTGPDGSPVTVAVRQHGELGPVLTLADQHFMSQSEALARDGSDDSGE